MKFVEPPVSRTDDLDDLLRSYFQAEMPSPWPALKLPEERTVLPLAPRQVRTWSPLRSRLALAASVGLLLTGALLFSGPPQPRDPTGAPADGGHNLASKPRDLPVAPRDSIKLPGGGEVEIKESLEQDGSDPTKFIIELSPRK